MNVDYTSDGQANDRANDITDGDDASDMADMTDASSSTDEPADDEANDTTDGVDMADTADTTDANVFEIITHTQANGLLDLDSTTPNPAQIQLAKVETPPENPPQTNPVRPVKTGSPDAHPRVVVELFTHGAPGAPINDMQGYSMYELGEATLHGSVWAPFQSECDWRFAHWAKTNGPTSSALADLLAIPDVCLLLILSFVLLNVV
jgi:hypothetical protein